MTTRLILTVGTGTAGPHSNLVQGLVNSLAIVQPDAYWLMPSDSPDSIAVADLVRELHPVGFTPWTADSSYHLITKPDSIAACRDAVSEVLRHIGGLHREGDRLMVNPTSGTKQMSSGATLAALDLEVDEIQFTVGERADGVVKTGSERIERFDPAGVFLSRDLRIAAELSHAGSHLAAHRLLARHSGDTARDGAAVALCLHEWERQNYEAARQIAARPAHPSLATARAPLHTLAQAAREGKPHAAIIADLLATADLLHRRGDHESSLFLACKALESGVRLRLFQSTGLYEPYSLDLLRTLPLKPNTLERLKVTSLDGSTTVLGLNVVVDILEALGDPLAEDYRADRRIAAHVRSRNEYTHGLRPIEPSASQALIALVRNLLSVHLDLPDPAPRPTFTA